MRHRDWALALLFSTPLPAMLEACGGEGDDEKSAASREEGGSDPNAEGGAPTPGAVDLAALIPMRRSGTRLKRRLVGPVGGTDFAFASWFDAERNETCDFGRSALLPGICAPETIPGPFGTGAMFTNSRCTVPIVGTRGTCKPAAYADIVERLDPDAGAWGPTTANLRPIGAEIPMPGTGTTIYAQVARPPQNDCRGLSSAASHFEHSFTVGPALPSTAFVALGAPTSSQRVLTTLSTTTADGATLVTGFALAGTAGTPGLPCTVETYKDGSLRCVDTVRARPLFGEPTCSRPAAYATSAARQWLVVSTPTSCFPEAVTAYHATRLPAADAGTLFESTGGACRALLPRAGEFTYSLGAEIPAGMYPPATELPGSGAPVQAVIRNVDGHGEVVGFRDAVHGRCDFQKTGDGKTRCVPIARTTVSFLDAACTQPETLYSYPVTKCGDAPPAAPLIPRLTVTCGETQVLNVYKAAAETRPVFDKLADGKCVPAQTARFTVAEQEVPITELVEGEFRTE